MTDRETFQLYIECGLLGVVGGLKSSVRSLGQFTYTDGTVSKEEVAETRRHLDVIVKCMERIAAKNNIDLL